MAGLSARADDVTRIGEMLLEHGSWRGRQLVPATWIDAMKPKPPADVGLACFAQYEIIRSRMTAKLLDTWIAAGVDPELVEAVDHMPTLAMTRRSGVPSLIGKFFPTRSRSTRSRVETRRSGNWPIGRVWSLTATSANTLSSCPTTARLPYAFARSGRTVCRARVWPTFVTDVVRSLQCPQGGIR
jgi:CubicO group peptidase (beta-lactamase class C family)